VAQGESTGDLLCEALPNAVDEPHGPVSEYELAFAEATRSAACHDRLLLSDGTTVRMPEMAVIDGHSGREAVTGDVGHLIAKIRERRLAVQFAGRVCDDGCRPFLLWASEPPR
jgi:hypothetical protein